MKFDRQRFFAYDNEQFPKLQLTDILQAARNLTHERAALGGAEDAVEALQVIQEWYETHATKIPYREIQRAREGAAIDPLYNEPKNARLTTHREMLILAQVNYAKPDIKHQPQGQQTDQPIKAHCSLLGLHAADYYPEPGDHIVFKGRVYHVTNVYVDDNCYFLNTGIPLHVTCDAEIRSPDGSSSRAVKRISQRSPHPQAANNLMQRLGGTTPA